MQKATAPGRPVPVLSPPPRSRTVDPRVTRVGQQDASRAFSGVLALCKGRIPGGVYVALTWRTSSLRRGRLVHEFDALYVTPQGAPFADVVEDSELTAIAYYEEIPGP